MYIYFVVLYFFIYGFLGWCTEVAYAAVKEGKFVNRGFLNGPICPIYGIGVSTVIHFLQPVADQWILLYILSTILVTLLEGATGFLLEKLFHHRWWDYSEMKYNINGRICLETLIPFGLLGCFAIYVVNPIIFSLFDIVDIFILKILALILFIVFVIDFIISLKIINSFKDTSIKFLKKDNTEEITKKVKEILLSKSVWTKRLIESFPKVKAVITNNIDLIRMKFELKQTKKELKQTKKELRIVNRKLSK